ncbi:hypothetical protein Pfo_017130 [Paulownia fortunei]|nr:hypothetical protein Pfo_017130 [Paulownia fortunei]
MIPVAPLAGSLNMEMRAIEDIAIGQDLTPPLSPLVFVLHDSALSSYCSVCFSTLPPQPFPPFTPIFPQIPCHVPSNTPTPLYCSPSCSSIDSPLHFSSSERHLLSLFRRSPPSSWNESSDLRLSLRLAYIFQKLPQECRLPRFSGLMSSDQRLYLGGKKDYPFQENENVEGSDDYLENKEEPWENMESCCQNNGAFERIAGLMTNREKLVFGENRNNHFQGSDEGGNPDENRGNYEDSGENTYTVLEKIKEGAKVMAKARRMCVDEDVNVEKQEEFVLEEMVLCLVLTNAVEVQDKSGCSIGIAVYDTAFSWINHSCSPNACYRFLMGLEHNEQPPLRIASAAKSGCGNGYGNDLIVEGDLQHPFSGDVEKNGYGPRIIVRSIKAVNKGEEVTIAYTDLLQPKEMRQAELWLKYRFSCSCKRCGVVPTTYVDYALQALSAANPYSPESPDNKMEKLMQSFDDAITDYLSFGDPISCWKKLENLLSYGHLSGESLAPKEAKSPQKLKLLPFHYLSLNAYTTLASVYKVHASDLLALEVERHKLESFNMYKTSAAYSLLLAGVTHHLFMFESALVATVANYWINAGESMLNLARSSLWDSFLKPGPIHLEFSSFLTHKCNCSCFADTLEPNSIGPDQNTQLEIIKCQLNNCIAIITPKVWSILASESSFLKLIQNPIDFSWLPSPEISMIPDIESHLAKSAVKERSSQLEAEECNDQVRMNLILLSIHCLRYGALLSSICCGLSVEMNYHTTLAVLKESD